MTARPPARSRPRWRPPASASAWPRAPRPGRGTAATRPPRRCRVDRVDPVSLFAAAVEAGLEAALWLRPAEGPRSSGVGRAWADRSPTARTGSRDAERGLAGLLARTARDRRRRAPVLAGAGPDPPRRRSVRGRDPAGRRLGAVRAGLAGPAGAAARASRRGGATLTGSLVGEARRRPRGAAIRAARAALGRGSRARGARAEPERDRRHGRSSPRSRVAEQPGPRRTGTGSSGCSRAPSAAAGSTRSCWRGGSTSGRRSSSTSPTPCRRARRERPGEHDLRLPPRRPDVPGRDAGAARPHGRPRVPDRRDRRDRSRRGADAAEDAAARPRAAGVREGPRGARDRRRRDPRPAARRSPRPSTSRRSRASWRCASSSTWSPRSRARCREARGLLALAGGCIRRPRSAAQPRDVALALLDEHEGFDRGWYAGPGRLARRATATASCGRAALRGRRRHAGHAVRRLRHRRRLRPGPRVGGVADEAARRRRRRWASADGDEPMTRRAPGLLRAFVDELVARRRARRRRVPRVAVDAAGARAARARRRPRPGPARRAGRRVLRPGHGPDRAGGRSRVLVTSGTAASSFAPGGRRGALRAGAAGGADRRPAARAARPRRAADDRPGPPLRRASQVVRGAAAARRRPGDDGARRAGSPAARSRPRAAAPAGPVHLNVPFREPLLPDGPLGARRRPGRAGPVRAASSRADAGARRRGASTRSPARSRGVERGLIVAGPDDDPALPAALAALAARDGLPDPRRPALRAARRAARPSHGRRPRRPARAARALARGPPPGARHPHRRHADVQADRRAAGAHRGPS